MSSDQSREEPKVETKNSRFLLGEASSTVGTLNDGDTEKFLHSPAQNASILKLKHLVLVQIANACRLGAFVFFIFGLVSAGTLCVAIGIVNIHRCPQQKYLPVYLVAEGVLMLVALPHVVLVSGNRSQRAGYSDLIGFVYKVLLIGCEICILVMGTVAVYASLPPNFDPAAGPHCTKICFLAAFFVVTATWLFILVLIIFAALLMCCLLFCNGASSNNPRLPPA